MTDDIDIRAIRVVDEAILALAIGDTEKLLSLLTTVQDVQIFCAKDEAASFAVRCNVLGALLRESARNLRLLRPVMKSHFLYSQARTYSRNTSVTLS